MENSNVTFIVDEFGNRTHAVVPIGEWLKTENMNRLNPFANSYDTMQSSYPITHLRQMLTMVMTLGTVPIEDWDATYKQYFHYFSSLKAEDIALLYLMRNSEFRYILRDETNKQGDKLYEDYFLVSMDGEKLTNDDVRSLNQNMYGMGEYEFIKFFKLHYKFRVQRTVKMRLSAERDRLFIHDLMVTFPMYMDNYYAITKETAQDFLEKYLYHGKSGAKTQVQRALREADARINQGEWQRYLNPNY